MDQSTEIDQIIGCGQRNGLRYFLVRFKNSTENDLIDWEAAKEYSLQVMEYFGSRLVWTSVHDIIDPECLADQQEAGEPNEAQASTSTAATLPPSNPPNDIEYLQ